MPISRLGRSSYTISRTPVQFLVAKHASGPDTWYISHHHDCKVRYTIAAHVTRPACSLVNSAIAPRTFAHDTLPLCLLIDCQDVAHLAQVPSSRTEEDRVDEQENHCRQPETRLAG